MMLTKGASALLFWGLFSLSVQAAPQPLSSTAVVDPPTAAGLLKAAQEALQKEQQVFNAKMIQQNGTIGHLFVKEDLAEPKQEKKSSLLSRTGKKVAVGAAVGALGLLAAHQVPRRQQKGNLFKKNTRRAVRSNLARGRNSHVRLTGDDVALHEFEMDEKPTKDTFYARGQRKLPEFLQKRPIRGVVGVPLATLDSMEDVLHMLRATMVDPYAEHPFLQWNRNRAVWHNLQHLLNVQKLSQYRDEMQKRADIAGKELNLDAQAYYRYSRDMIDNFMETLFQGGLYDEEMRRESMRHAGHPEMEASAFVLPEVEHSVHRTPSEPSDFLGPDDVAESAVDSDFDGVSYHSE